MTLYRVYQYPAKRQVELGAGISTAYGSWIAPGAQIAAYVRSGGVQTNILTELSQKTQLTLNAGLAQCRAGMGDIVLVAHDHAENVASADQMSNLVAGTRIMGLGYGNLRPTFTWTATAASFLLDVANVQLHNCILRLAGPVGTTALTVTAPITVSGAGCQINNCEINWGVDADQLCTIGITTQATADQFVFANNRCFAAADGGATTFLQLVGSDHAVISGNEIVGGTSAVAVGPIRFITTDSLHVSMVNNYIRNSLTASTGCVTVAAGATSSSGRVDYLHLSTLANGANQLVLGHADGAWAASAAAFNFGRFINVANLDGERAAEVTVVSA